MKEKAHSAASDTVVCASLGLTMAENLEKPTPMHFDSDSDDEDGYEAKGLHGRMIEEDEADEEDASAESAAEEAVDAGLAGAAAESGFRISSRTCQRCSRRCTCESDHGGL